MKSLSSNLLAVIAAVLCSSMSAYAKPAVDNKNTASKQATPPAKACPKGFTSMGTIIKIEVGKGRIVTETIHSNGGTIEKMEPFKADKTYQSKVGDAYCFDQTPDND